MKPWKSTASAAWLLLVAAFLGLLLLGCNSGAEVESEVGGGRLYTAGGLPAAGAKVRIYGVGHAPQPTSGGEKDGLIYSTTTDKDGFYRIDSVPVGQYNVLGEKDGECSMQDSVFLGRSTDGLEPDTLKAPATVSGLVALEPNHDPRSVLVQVLGTAGYANVDRQGRFELGPLGVGKYLLRFITTEVGYMPTLYSFQVMAGEQLVLPDTLRVLYTGIPVVRGLSARFDTLNQVVTLTWSPADYANLDKYYVLRGEADNLAPNLSIVGKTQDTIFRDSTFSKDPFFQDGARRLEYRVRVYNKSEEFGPTYGSVEVEAAPRSLLETAIALEREGGKPLRASINDTVRLIATMTNAARSLREVRWNVWGQPQLSRRASLSGNKTADTLTIVSSETFNTFVEIQADALDGVGAKRIVNLQVIGDQPVALAGKDTLVTLGDTALLVGSETDEFGRIVKREWDIGGTGEWRTVAPNEPVLAAGPALLGDTVLCLYRVTDDDGLIGIGRKVLRGMAQRRVPLPVSRTGTGDLHEVGGELFSFMNPGAVLHSYHPASRKWASRKAYPGELLQSKNKAWTESVGLFEADRIPSAVLGGLIYAFVKSTPDSTVLVAYDPKTDQWTAKKALPEATHQVFMLPLDGKLYVLEYLRNGKVPGTKRLWEYDPAADEWKRMAYPPQPVFEIEVWTAFKGRIVVPEYGDNTLTFDPGTNQWSNAPRPMGQDFSEPIDGLIPDIKEWNMSLVDPFDGSNWASIPFHFSYTRWKSLSVTLGTRVFFFLESNADAKGPIQVFNIDVKTRVWGQGEPIPAGFDMKPVSKVLNGRIYMRDASSLIEYFE